MKNMRKQKRDMSARAYKKGYMAGLAGKPKDMCPLEKIQTRQEWINGWREGREDHWSGLTQGVSSIHKMPNLTA